MTREWLITQFQNFLNYLKNLFIITYLTMPSTEALLLMPKNEKFRVIGFYDIFDGNGGLYMIASNNSVKGGLKLNSSYSLVALDQYGNPSSHIDACRYGIREYSGAINFSTITAVNTYATANSNIINNLNVPDHHATLKFPNGRFFFEDTLDLHNRHLSLQGDSFTSENDVSYYTSKTDGQQGTTLIFPFLANNGIAIDGIGSSITNVTIIGNPLVYDYQVDRTQLAENPENVITETINSNIKCEALRLQASVVDNVSMLHFYTGLNSPNASNTFIGKIYAYHCHYGAITKNDHKVTGIYGGFCDTLAKLTGSLTSVSQIRGDSCNHILQISSGNNITVNDIDGDWIMNELIIIGGDSTSSNLKTVNEINLLNVHGRCNVLKRYDKDDAQYTNGIDVRDLQDNSGYGYIRVMPYTTFKDSKVTFNSVGLHTPYDGNENCNLILPQIALTFNGTVALFNLMFEINGTYTADRIKAVFQTQSNATYRIDCANASYFVNGSNINNYVTMSEVQAYINELLNKDNGDDAS